MLLHRNVATTDRAVNAVRWIARIGGILLALSMLAFFVADVVTGHVSLAVLNPAEIVFAWLGVGVLVAQIVGIAVAWIWEGLGGAIVLAAALVSIVVSAVSGSFPQNELLFGLIGAMFLYVWWRTQATIQRRTV